MYTIKDNHQLMETDMALDWRKSGGEWIASRNGRTVFSIEKRRGGYGLRRWSVRLDGTEDMCGVEIVRTVQEAKAYANNLLGSGMMYDSSSTA